MQMLYIIRNVGSGFIRLIKDHRLTLVFHDGYRRHNVCAMADMRPRPVTDKTLILGRCDRSRALRRAASITGPYALSLSLAINCLLILGNLFPLDKGNKNNI